MEWQREMSDPNEFMSTLKIDLYPEEVYTFTPKGKVVVLPKDASPIDFAYAIHTEVGNTTVGAKVNGRIVPLRTKLRNGDIVEITTQTGHAPSRDWLTFTKTPRARNKIKHWINEHQRERAIEIGQKLLDREARKYKIGLSKFHEADYDKVAAEYGLTTPTELLAGIGFGKFSARQVLNKLEPGSTIAQRPRRSTAPSATPSTTCPTPSNASSSARFRTRSRSKARTTCSSTAPAVATPSAAKRSSATSPAAKASPSTPAAVPTSRTCSTSPTAASRSSGPASPKTNPAPAPDLPRQAHRPLRRPRRPAQGIHRHHLRRRHQHPLLRLHPRDGGAVIDFVIETVDVRHLNRLVDKLRRVQGVRDVTRSQKL